MNARRPSSEVRSLGSGPGRGGGTTPWTGGALQEAARLVTEVLKVPICRILELDEGERQFRVSTLVGPAALGGLAAGEVGMDSQAGFTLQQGEPIAVLDFREEHRFCVSPLIPELGIVSGLSVLIPGRERSIGALCVNTLERRAFSRGEIDFLSRMAAVLGPAMDRFAETEERFLQMAENISEVFWLWSPSMGEVLYVSPAYAEIWGRTCESLRNDPETIFDSVHPADRLAFQEAIERRARGEIVQLEFRIVRPDEAVRWVWDRGFPVRDERGEVYRIAGTAADITWRKGAEDALKSSQQSLAAAQQLARLGNWDWNIARNELWWSDEIYRIFGLKPHEFGATYDAFLMTVHPEDRHKVQVGVERALRDRAPYELDHRIVLPDGTERTVHEKGEVTHGDGGQPTRMLGTVQDVTEQRRAEAMLRKVSRAVEQTADSVLITDRNGLIEYVNPAFESISGYSAGEVLGKTPRLLKSGRHSTAVYAEMWRRISQGEVYRSELVNRRKNGELYYEEKTITPIKDDEGQVTHFVATGRDITDRKRAEEALRRSEEWFRSLIQNALDIIMVIEEGGQFVFASPSTQRVLGYESAELAQRSLFDFVAAEDFPRVLEAFLEAMRAPSSLRPLEFRFRHADGSWRTLEALGKSVSREGAGLTLVLNARDTTHKAELEAELRQAQKLEALGKLAAGISHDFNNLLVVIQGYSNWVLAEPDLTAEGREALDEISAATDRASQLTRKLLTFSSGQRMELEVLDLNVTVQNLLKMLRRLIGEQITVEFEAAERVPPIEADLSMIEQVVLNLSVNARDAMPEGGTLKLRTAVSWFDSMEPPRQAEFAPGEYVCLTVHDTGSGISAEHRTRIFEPFFTTKEVGKGTGLGLATVYGIVQQHRGWIDLETQVGRGTTFRIYFPARPDLTHTVRTKVAAVDLRGGAEQIVLVEDESAVRSLLARLLRHYGYSVQAVEAGPQALAAFENTAAVHLLITDIILPQGLNGVDLAASLRKARPSLRVLLVTGYEGGTGPELARLGSECGLLRKPFRPCELIAAVREILDRRPQEPPGG